MRFISKAAFCPTPSIEASSAEAASKTPLSPPNLSISFLAIGFYVAPRYGVGQKQFHCLVIVKPFETGF